MESRHLGGGGSLALAAGSTYAGATTVELGTTVKYGHSQKLLRLDEMPKDMTRLRLDPSNGPDDATFKATAGNKFLGATSRKK